MRENQGKPRARSAVRRAIWRRALAEASRWEPGNSSRQKPPQVGSAGDGDAWRAASSLRSREARCKASRPGGPHEVGDPVGPRGGYEAIASRTKRAEESL